MSASASTLPHVRVGTAEARLEFTPQRVEPVGRLQIDGLFLSAIQPGPDQMQAIAQLMDIASGGAIPHGLVMMERPDADLAVPALYEAWLFSWRGPPKRRRFGSHGFTRATTALARLFRPITSPKGNAHA